MTLSEKLLAERAALLARRHSKRTQARPGLPLLIVTIGSQRVGLEVAHLRRVLSQATLTPVPGYSQDLLGLVNDDGVIRPVFSLERLLSMASSENVGEIVFVAARKGVFGLAVVRVEGIEEIDPENIAATTSELGLSAMARGVGPDNLLVLDHAALEAAVYQS